MESPQGPWERWQKPLKELEVLLIPVGHDLWSDSKPLPTIFKLKKVEEIL